MDARPLRHLLAAAAALAVAAAVITVAAGTSVRAHTAVRPAADTSYLTVGATAARRTAAPIQALPGLGTVLPKYSCAQLASEDSARSRGRRPRSSRPRW
jgi:hypothetical protein